MDYLFPALLTIAALFLWIRSATNSQKRLQDANLDRFVARSIPAPKQSSIEGTILEETSADVPVRPIDPLFVNPVPEDLEAYCEIETPYQNFFLELPFANISRSREFIVSKTRLLIELAQEYDLDVEISGHNELKIGHFLRWENFSDKGAVIFSEFRLAVYLGPEVGDSAGNPTRYDIFAEVRVEPYNGDDKVSYSRFSDDSPLRSISSAKKCIGDYVAALEAAAERSDLLIPVTRHCDLPDLIGINERDTFKVVRTRLDGELEALDLCDMKVGIYSLTRDFDGVKLRDSGIKWIAAYSKQMCGLVDLKLTSIKSISPDILDRIKSTEEALSGPPSQ